MNNCMNIIYICTKYIVSNSITYNNIIIIIAIFYWLLVVSINIVISYTQYSLYYWYGALSAIMYDKKFKVYGSIDRTFSPDRLSAFVCHLFVNKDLLLLLLLLL
jgi:hypothetical protein